jgi:hypothetical protein
MDEGFYFSFDFDLHCFDIGTLTSDFNDLACQSGKSVFAKMKNHLFSKNTFVCISYDHFADEYGVVASLEFTVQPAFEV